MPSNNCDTLVDDGICSVVGISVVAKSSSSSVDADVEALNRVSDGPSVDVMRTPGRGVDGS